MSDAFDYLLGDERSSLPGAYRVFRLSQALNAMTRWRKKQAADSALTARLVADYEVADLTHLYDSDRRLFSDDDVV